MKKTWISLVLLAAVSATYGVVLPFSETFDGLPAGSIHGADDWIVSAGSGVVQSNQTAAGAGALEISSGSVSRQVSSDRSTVWIRFQARITEAPSADPEVSGANTSVAFFVNTNRNLVVYNGTTPVVAAGVSVPLNDWVRFDVYCDYGQKKWTLSLNGTNVTESALGFYSAAGVAVDSMVLANAGAAPIYIDEIDVAVAEPVQQLLGDVDNDGLPDWWELSYAGSLTAANTNSVSENGLTYLQNYIAGISPLDVSQTLVMLPQSLRKFGWTRQHGRKYDVFWTASLTSGFQRIAEDVQADEFEDLDSVRAGNPAGFYQLRVRKE